MEDKERLNMLLEIMHGMTKEDHSEFLSETVNEEIAAAFGRWFFIRKAQGTIIPDLLSICHVLISHLMEESKDMTQEQLFAMAHYRNPKWT